MKPKLNGEVKRRGLVEAEAALYLGVSISTLRKSRMDGERKNRLPPPPYLRAGRKVLYLIDDLDLWLESQRVTQPEYQAVSAGGAGGAGGAK